LVSVFIYFCYQITLVFNNYIGVAVFASSEEISRADTESQLLACRYFFSQFWCEFTAEVLQEFYNEDVIFRRKEMETNIKIKNLDGLPEAEKKREMMKIMENKSTIFQKEEITKRNFYLQLFRTYCEVPFQETMQSFVKVFNDVFVKEKP
jgi:hypothetical protein